MLSELRITGLGVIDDAYLEPHRGFTVVTGETGAGKTMIVTALGLITGGRGDADRVRTGADRSVVEARLNLDPDHPARQVVAAAGGTSDDDGSVIVVRSVSADGRSRAHVGGRSAPLATLSAVTGDLVAVHGQAEAMRLLRPAEQRVVLDRYGATDAELGAYREHRADWAQAVRDLQDRTANARERAQREQMLTLALAEIDAVAPQPGEDAAVTAGIRRLENADTLRAAAETALAALSGLDTLMDTPTAISLIDRARHALDAAADERLAALVPGMSGALAVLGDAAAELSGYLQELGADPSRLEALLTRQAALRSLTRKYGADADAVRSWADAARQELEALDSSDEALAGLARRRDAAAARLAAAATALSDRRAKAAARLGRAATAELTHLAMGRAALTVRVTSRPAGAGEERLEINGTAVAAGADGIDQVEILLRSRPDTPELPIARAASGGELSRIMLALEVVLAGADPVDTLVFDEVDAGVGGRAATEIGRRLAALAASHQVIVVTHLAQVAAFADRHYLVDAGEDGRVAASQVRAVDGADRQAELARMLGGTEGRAALAHAADLLTAARASR